VLEDDINHDTKVLIENLYRLFSGKRLSYLHCLKDIKEHLQDKGEGTIPTRKDILLAIDLDYSERSQLSWLNKELPPEFPFVSNWIK